MKKRILASLVLASVSLTAQANEKVIYGNDDRLDPHETTNNLHLEISRSTAAMIGGSALRVDSNGEYQVSGSSLQSRGMCASERFAKQPTAARCSGFFVGEDLLVTAGHCVKSARDCSSYKWVFDYKIDPNKDSITVAKSAVYSCKKIIKTVLDRGSKDDYALIRLDRKVVGRTALDFRRSGKVKRGTKLVVIGHPSGLPTKIADGAIVRNNNPGRYFVANLDTYGGNSGSAVFDAETGVVEGILVRGETDYVYDRRQGCRVSNRCSDTGCRGEDVTRITNIEQLKDLI